MKIPIHIAEKLLELSNGVIITASSAKHSIIDELVLEGILHKTGRIKKSVRLHDKGSLHTFLQNRYQINDLESYIKTHNQSELTRAELVTVSSDSKSKLVRTFKGFLINCYSPVHASLNNKLITFNPKVGTFNFIYDFEKFIPSPGITIVGIENPENFRYIDKQKYLFPNITPLFVCRYPQNQSKDLIKWLQIIPNNYLHFGDFDFAGIGIYINEYKKHLKEKASFFVPENIENLIMNSGNKNRYDVQKINFDINHIEDENLLKLISTIHKHKKGLDQEILIL